jgi:hypothetical protein
MKPRIKSKCLLRPQRTSAGRFGVDKDEIPTGGRYRARNEQELVLVQQFISERLLTGAGNAGSQPVWVGNGRGLDNVHIRRLGYVYGGQDMRNGIQRPKSRVSRYLENRRGGIDRAVYRPDAFAIPPSSDPIRSFAVVPGPGERRAIQPPRYELAPTQQGWQRRQV